ncbi:nadh-ubiquinone oxidoreductase aggg subunit [Holotrichia oblita]|uniref:Nadh-ubiquinone oxidoreductase aggg subunit n=1 Tax=Holotrichia oblita TaxID=644536 RepID=A0ACB9TSF5_HOLOL|nr:nadh-ubiquinone oxidoreductase aggg subunit [Holotrichia oblita]
MLFARIRLVLLRTGLAQSRPKTFVRYSHGSWHYRKLGPPPTKTIEFLATVAQGTTWWWIMWHVFTEYQHVTGEWEYPTASIWSDKELGVPPDDVDDSIYSHKAEIEEVVSAVAEDEPHVTEETNPEAPEGEHKGEHQGEHEGEHEGEKE